MSRWPRSCRCSTPRRAPLAVIRQNAIDSGASRRAVDEHQRHADISLVPQHRFVGPRGNHHETINPAGGEGVDRLALASRIVGDARSENGDPAGPRGFFHAGVDRGGELVGDVLDHQPDGGGAAIGAAQVARGEVRAIIELVRGPAYLGQEFLGDPGLIVDDP